MYDTHHLYNMNTQCLEAANHKSVDIPVTGLHYNMCVCIFKYIQTNGDS